MTVPVETTVLPAARFFVTGGTLQSDAASYVTRQADDALFSSLLAGEYCYVLNSRQMGKSSLMVRTAQRLRAEGVTVADIDLTAIGQNLTPDQWYDGLLMRLGRKLDCEDALETFYLDNDRLSPFQRWQEALVRIVLPDIRGLLVLFVDEIDVVRSLPFSADEFFAGIRQCYVERATDPEYFRLCFCLLGTATPADLIQDTKASPFNIGKRIEVRDFTAEEAFPLAKGLGPKGEALLKRILYWTGGHPDLTQRLCHSVSESDARTAGDVDRLCAELFLTHKAKETDDNLMFVRNRLLKSEADLAGLLDLYRNLRAGRRVVDDDANPLIGILKLSGVARVANGELQVRNRIYSHVFSAAWVDAHMPGSELRRQKEAYRQGLMKVVLPGAWMILLPQLAGVLVGGHTDRASLIAAFLAYGLVVGIIGSVTFGFLFRPESVRPGLMSGLAGLTLLCDFLTGPLGADLPGLENWTGGISVWLPHFLMRSLSILVNYAAVVLPIYFLVLRKRGDYSPRTVGYLGAVSGLAAGYALAMIIGAIYVTQGPLGPGAHGNVHSSHWPLNGEQLVIFLLGFFMVMPLTLGLLSGIAGYTVGLARESEHNAPSLVAKGLLLYYVLVLVINGTDNNLVRTTVAAATLLACVHYAARRNE